MKKVLSATLMMGVLFGMLSFCSVEKSAVPNNGPRWEKLGMKIVSMKADHDVIPVTIKEGRFTALKFKVLKAPIHLLNVKVHYANGSSHNLAIAKRIAKGTESRVFDLPGDKRIIKKITFNYKSIPNGNGRAVIVAWGRH